MYPQQMEGRLFVIQTFTTNKNVILLGTSRDQGSLQEAKSHHKQTNRSYKVAWCHVMNGTGKLWKGLSSTLNMLDYSAINFEIGIFTIL